MVLYKDLDARIAVGSAMKAWRERRHIRAGAIADALGVDAGTFSKYESGRVDVSLTMLVRWCDALGVTPRYPLEKFHEARHGGRAAMRSGNTETIHNPA